VTREVPGWNLCREIHDLEAEHREWLAPDLRRWRDHVETLREKVHRVDRRTRPEREARARIQRLELDAEAGGARMEQLERERSAEAETARARIRQLEVEGAAEAETARVRIDHLERQRRGADAQMANLAAEIAAVRASLSWRLTAPLRFVGAWLL